MLYLELRHASGEKFSRTGVGTWEERKSRLGANLLKG